MAPAPTRSGRRPSSTSSSSRPSSRTLLIVGAVLLAAIAGYLFYRSRSSSSANDATSGTPGPDRTGGAIDNMGPSGGASNAPGQLPVNLLSQPDQLQQQVQTTDAGASTTSEAPTSSPTSYAYVNPSTSTTVGYDLPVPYVAPYAPLQGVPQSPGSDALITVSSHPGTGYQTTPGSQPGAGANYYAPAPALNTPTGSNARRPGFQV